MIKQLLIVLMCCISVHATATESISQEKKQVIDQVLAITGTLSVTDVMGNDMSQQMIDGLYHRQWSLQPEIISTIRDEVNQIIQDEFITSGLIREIAYTIYDQHFSLPELKEILAFYKTPTGEKLTLLLPQITRETLIESRKQGSKLVPLIQERMKKRFEALELQ